MSACRALQLLICVPRDRIDSIAEIFLPLAT